MDNQSYHKAWKRQVILLFLYSWGWVSGQLRYSIVEETEPESFVGNVAQDMGLNQVAASKINLHLGSGESRRYFYLNQGNGALYIKERIDRESICGTSTSCLLHIEVVAENPVELFSLEIEILDINDNSPTFLKDDHTIQITELFETPGAHYPLGIAQDLDVGINRVNKYVITPTPYFSLSVKNRKDGVLVPELILEKALDREEIKEHRLILTAIDGGEKPRSGTCHITVTVLDINDNAPVFEKPNYKIYLPENPPHGKSLILLNATDLDEGLNGEFEYSFDEHNSNSVRELFDLNTVTGEIYVVGTVDFEASNFYELSVKAKDKGTPALVGRCFVQIEVEDVNDNPPEIHYTSVTNEVPENADVGTVVGFISVRDRDSGKNKEIQLNIIPNLPFEVKLLKNHYSLVTKELLDREKMSQYTVHLVATDLGSPPLQTETIIILNVSDINDNPPRFIHPYYNAFIKENNDPGTFLCRVSAADPDEGVNSELFFSLVERHIDGSSVSSFIYINPTTGDIYAQRTFDYEHIQVLEITVKAEDSGFPKLFSNVSVVIFISDANDNYPIVLYPERSREIIYQEKISKSASIGHLVTKVSAVDSDSGHNAWLHFSFFEDTDMSCFQISANTGEIRTTKSLQETENTERRLVILISDHGEAPLTTTTTILVNIVDSILQERPKSQVFLTNSENTSDLTLYLIVSLVAISLVSLITFIILLVKCLKRGLYDTRSVCCFPNRTEFKQPVDQYQPTLYLNTDGTLKYMEVRMVPPETQRQCYQACFLPATETQNVTNPLTFPQLKDIFNENAESVESNCPSDQSQQAQPNADWRFSQAAQKPGPSGTQPTEEAGVWPNNQFETERLQAMILASANEAAEGTSGLGGGTGTMGLSARYGPQFTLQHVPDYRQNVYIPGSTLTPTNGGGKREGKGNKKKSSKKDKK
ncbi:protocadherin gamma subfamily A, 3 L homeolog isoform X14 [Xenopus laevis]|uniref:Protocadherin gamma subfamily A, 3 L homeolog isoform X14 n=1 Tax=Xenopus laevis TaxID=8355 RepID=A0A8J1MH36_XENLA|nr:protocadherin gamma subfamily A, 3 L homeolog isoform X14 [Xenopus laevis]